MIRFLRRLLIFLALMFVLDRLFGLTMDYMQQHAMGGYVGHHNYFLNNANEDILIFGSSRAIHHYNPNIIKDSLGMSCYNCGQDGNGIILFYGWWQIIKQHYKPKMIIYDVTSSFDLFKGDNSTYLGWLRSEYDNMGVRQIFEDIDPMEKYKMMSMMYRYNSKFLQNIIDFIHPIYKISKNGYLPLKGKLNTMKIKKKHAQINYSYDSLKLKYIEKLISETKKNNVKIIFVASPVWYGRDTKEFNPIGEICKQNNLTFYDFSNDSDFVRNDTMFKDGSHLNAFGADVFTAKLCQIIKKGQ